jgi:hypothetical protein
MNWIVLEVLTQNAKLLLHLFQDLRRTGSPARRIIGLTYFVVCLNDELLSTYVKQFSHILVMPPSQAVPLVTLTSHFGPWSPLAFSDFVVVSES